MIKYKGCGKNRQGLVKWLNWPKKFNSWISISQLQDF